MLSPAILMKNALRNILVSVLLSGAALALGGCVAVAVGAGAAGAVAYIRGELQESLSADVIQVQAATEEAIEELKFFPLSAKKDALTGVFEMRSARDDKITIVVEKQGEGVTKVRIRVGPFGDETMSRSILDAIKRNL